VSTPDNLKRMKFPDRASTRGQMARYTKVNGPKTKCTVLVNLCGRTAKNTKENSEMTNAKEMEFSTGKTVESTMVSGAMESSTARVCS